MTKLTVVHHCGDRQGFTLLEVVVVLILMGVLAAVAVAYVGNSSADVAGRTESIKSHLRYAQARAMSSGPLYDNQQVWGIGFLGNAYYFFHCTDIQNCDPSQRQIRIPGQPVIIDLSQDSISVTGNQTVAFDRLGRPFSDVSLSSPASNLTVSGSGHSRAITITPETGFIY